MVLTLLTEYSNDMKNISKNIEEWGNNESKILIMSDEKISDLLSVKKLNSRVTELFIGGRKLNISLVFNTQSYFTVTKENTVNVISLWKLQTKRASANCI